MGKVYIGVTAVGGYKLWGGGRWKINGRRRGGCGPGMPGPYGVAEGGVGAGGGGKRSGDGTLLRLLPHTKKISLRILCKSRILLL